MLRVSATLMPDPQRAGGWTLLLDGVEQSYVDSEAPTYLKFDYTRRFASVLDVAAPARRPLRVLHLGGGAMTMARYLAATRPGSPQTVVERDERVTRMVRRQLPLPAEEPIRLLFDDARATVEAMPAGGFDIVLADVYEGARVPASVSSVEFARAVERVLTPGGVFAANLADAPPLAFSRVQAATLRAVFADVCVIGETSMLGGRRYGNLVLVARERTHANQLGRLVRAAERDPARGRVLHGPAVDAFIAGAVPVRDADLV
jgi:spermidine synthase